MNTRIKSLRRQLKLSQTTFGEKLGVSRDVINNLENGRVEAKDLIIKTICSLFTVNEEWLRTGKGDMFIETKETALSKAADLLNLDETEQKFLSAYLSLEETQRHNFKEFWREIAAAYNSQDEIAATIATRPAADDKRLTRKQKEQLMHQQLDAEDKGLTSSASTITNGLSEKRA